MPDNSQKHSLISQQLDEYHLEELLGQGGMARVYRAYDPGLERWAAVKVIDTPFRDDPDYMQRFQREARAVAQLQHPNIVRLYRFGEVNKLLYIAMEYIDGPDLDRLLVAYASRQQPMPPAEVRQLIRQICLALDYAHSQGVIHRDIKPANIMINKNGDAIVTDFGLVLLSDQHTRGEIMGTPHYIAPEQAISSGNAVPQSDLYAVGVILYEMFTTRLPFDATHPYDVALMHIGEPPPPPRQVNPNIDPAVEAVILKALAKDPTDRYATGAALADALDQALGAERAQIPAVIAEPRSPPLISAACGAQANLILRRVDCCGANHPRTIGARRDDCAHRPATSATGQIANAPLQSQKCAGAAHQFNRSV